MSLSNIRIFVKYGSATDVALLNYGIAEQELVETVLHEFAINNHNWNEFELIIEKYKCKVKNSNQLRENDIVLLQKAPVLISLNKVSFKYEYEENNVESNSIDQICEMTFTKDQTSHLLDDPDEEIEGGYKMNKTFDDFNSDEEIEDIKKLLSNEDEEEDAEHRTIDDVDYDDSNLEVLKVLKMKCVLKLLRIPN